MKVIPGEECALQHKLLTCDLKLTFKTPTPKPFVPKRRVWKLHDPALQSDFCESVRMLLASYDILPTDSDAIWDVLKTTLLKTTEEVCGWTKRKNFRKETWWWDDSISKVVDGKRHLRKAWKKGKASKEEYLVAKRASKHAVYSAKKVAEQKKFHCVKEGDSSIFKTAKQMKRGNQDVVGEKCVLDDNENLCFDTTAKSKAWKEHYSCLLNQEFVWDQSTSSTVHPVVDPAPLVTVDIVFESVKKMKAEKAAGPTGVVSEMLIAGGERCMKVVADLINSINRDRKMPKDWEESYIINLYKGKGDALVRGNYRGLKLLEHVMKVLEQIVETQIRSSIKIDDMQFGFMPGSGTTDAIFIVRQLQEKFLAKNKNLYLAFIDLEKVFDRVPRHVIWWAMRKLGIDEWIIQLVQAMYCEVRSNVCVNNCFSDSFNVNVGVHQGSVLSLLLFIIVLEALLQEFRTGSPWELLYADDLVIIAETIEELSQKLDAWKVNLEKKVFKGKHKKDQNHV